MKDGFISVATAIPHSRVGNVFYNTDEMIKIAREASADGVKVLAFPELALTSYSVGDLVFSRHLLVAAEQGLSRFMSETAELDTLFVLGLPVRVRSKVYNAAAVVSRGRLLGVVPKTHLPQYSEFREMRHFAPAPHGIEEITFAGQDVLFGTRLLFSCQEVPELVVAAEICEDMWSSNPPSVSHAEAGATVLVNLSASPEMVGKAARREQLVLSLSASLRASYVYVSAGLGESTDGLVFSGHCMISELGALLAASEPFEYKKITRATLDVQRIAHERRRATSFVQSEAEGYVSVPFSLTLSDCKHPRVPRPLSFVADDKAELARRCEMILSIQSIGLAERLSRTRAKCAVVGVSGGLDSTLALLVMARAVDRIGMPRSSILAVTMPGFGTTARTRGNAERLTEELGATLCTVDIREAVEVHFRDIGHDGSVTDVTYENAQARERTQILMDLANKEGGLVVGTGDLSELALGWATYNGDHMSMYGVNAGVPKTMLRHIVRYCADELGGGVAKVLYDVLDTPVSPELLPPKDGEIAQCTEDLVGPYELHDYFLYHMISGGASPEKIERMARLSFAGMYDEDTIRHWLSVFVRRFFAQQFKRACHPDGPKVGSVFFGGEWQMASDADASLWLQNFS